MVEELKSVISLLAGQHLQSHVPEALRGLVVCHQVFLRENNADGFFWSSKFTSGIIKRLHFSVTPDSLSELYGFLLSNWCYTGTSESESPEALAAFFVGMHSVQGEQLAIEWLNKSYGTAKSQLLRYHISFQLTRVYHEVSSYEECLTWLGHAKRNATSSDALQLMEYFTGATMLELGNVEGAHGVLAGSFGSDVFSQALSCMLDVQVKNHVSFPGTSLRERIAAYAEGRRLLINWCMPNFRRELARFISSDCCPQRFLIEFLELDGFSDYLNHELEAAHVMQDEASRPAIQLFSSYFAYKLYRFGRKRMIELQENVPAEGFMDPRPHIEEALDVYWHPRLRGDWKFDIRSLLVCLNISLKATDHTMSLALAAHILMIMVKHGLIQVSTACSIVSSNFDSADEEDPEAIAAYTFSGAASNDKLESYNMELLKRSVELARTPVLRAMTTLALGSVTDDLEEKLALLEKAKDFAVESGRDDLIFRTGFHLFRALYNAAKYAKMKYFRKQVVSLQAQYFPRSTLIQSLVQNCMDFIAMFEDYREENHSHVAMPSITLVNRGHSGIYNYFRSIEIEQAPFTFSSYTPRSHDGQTGKIKTLFYKFNKLVNDEKLEEAEEAGASLLVMIEASKDLAQLGKYRRQVLIGLALLCGRYYNRDYRRSNTQSRQVEETVAEVIHFFVTAALASDDSADFTAETLWCHSLALEALGWMNESMGKMAESMKVRLQEDANFENLSDDRIRYLDKQMYPRFQKLQLALFDSGSDVKQSLLWSERQRTRDFSFRLTRLDRKRYLKELVEFDIDDKKASEVIESAISMMGNETVALMINQYKTKKNTGWVYHTYFIHTSKAVACPREVRSEVDLALEPKEIRKLVEGDSITFNKIFERLHRIILEPFEAEFEEVKPKRIIFIPSKEMSAVPFNLLRNPATGKFLIQEYSIATVSSLRLLRHCFMRKEELEQVQTQTDVLVVGDPTSDLTWASKEADFVAKLFEEKTESDVTVLHQHSATKDAVLERLPASDWFHIASHAVVNQEFPDGALLLAPCCSATDQTPSPEDVIRALRASDSSERLLGDEIVARCGRKMTARGGVLSACTSGVGRQSAEGILALPRSFHLCGVPSMVVSLWPVDDGATENLMQLLYTKLIEGEEIADALRLAMLEMIEEEDDFYGEPVYSVREWAPFILSGCPTTILQINH